MSGLNANFLSSLLFAIILGMDALYLNDLVAFLELRKFLFYIPTIWEKSQVFAGMNYCICLNFKIQFVPCHFDVSLSKSFIF